MEKRKALLGLIGCILFLSLVTILQQQAPTSNRNSAKVGYVAASYLSDAVGAEGKVRGSIENAGAVAGGGAAVIGTGALATTLAATEKGAELGAFLGGPWGLLIGGVVGAV